MSIRPLPTIEIQTAGASRVIRQKGRVKMSRTPEATPPVARRWATVTDAITYTGLSQSTIRRALNAGDLTKHRFGKRILIDLDEIDAKIMADATPGDGVA